MRHNKKLIPSSMVAIEENDYLLTKILVRLSLRNVKIFKRVSKRWRSLISAPYFCYRHATVKRRISGMMLDLLTYSPHQRLKFFYLDEKTPSFFPKIPNLPPSHISQSCNGLMLIQSRNGTCIYNPTTGDKKRLPSPLPSFDSLYLHYSLAFDPFRFLGYKLICIYHQEDSEEDGYQTMIYSSEFGACWKQCGSSFSAPLDMDFAHGVYFNDSVYWIGSESKSKTMLRFDLKEECVKDDMPPLPQEPHHHDSKGYRCVLAPACGYMNLVGFDSKYRISIFRLKEDYYSSGWVLMHSIDLRCIHLRTNYQIIILTNYFNIGYACSILHLIEDGEDEMALLLQIPNKVIALRLKDNSWYDVLDLTKLKGNFFRYCSPGFKGWYRAFGYIESLASV